jgi:hypothetical protein
MSDNFIVYATEDRSKVEPIAKALEKQGWSIFWDRSIPGGKIWNEVIEEELGIGKCVIAIWSKNSKFSNWVSAEAEVGLKRDILVTVLIENTKAPL